MKAMYVPLDTPVLVRNRETGDIYVEKIEKLAKYCTWEKRGGTEVARVVDIDAWGVKGWTSVRRLCRQRVKGVSVFEIIHPKGTVCVLGEDPMLQACPKMPNFPELASDYVGGSTGVVTFRDLFHAQEEYARLKALNYKVSIDMKESEYILYKNNVRPANSMEMVVHTKEKTYDGFMYTFELEEGEIYQAGLGELMVCGVRRDLEVAS